MVIGVKGKVMKPTYISRGIKTVLIKFGVNFDRKGQVLMNVCGVLVTSHHIGHTICSFPPH